MAIRLKNDKYKVKRGGAAKLIDVICKNCNSNVLLYQKDGPGWLKRCYLNRIFWPVKYSKLQNDKSINSAESMPKLVCLNCRTVIGIPSRHKDGRWAFTLIRGSFKRRINKSVNTQIEQH